MTTLGLQSAVFTVRETEVHREGSCHRSYFERSCFPGSWTLTCSLGVRARHLITAFGHLGVLGPVSNKTTLLEDRDSPQEGGWLFRFCFLSHSTGPTYPRQPLDHRRRPFPHHRHCLLKPPSAPTRGSQINTPTCPPESYPHLLASFRIPQLWPYLPHGARGKHFT